jgi:outer membrane protein OmpA-like peptidoglycan-associated protein
VDQAAAAPFESGTDASDAPPEPPVALEPSETDALLDITITDDSKTPMAGVFISVSNASGQKFFSRESDDEGRVKLLLPKGASYTVNVVSLDLDENKKRIPLTIPDGSFVKSTLQLTFTAGEAKTFVLEGVLFDTAKATLKPASFPKLGNLLELMTLKKTLIIELAGHTDNVGGDAYNMKLSDDRAQSVKKYLVKKGIHPRRIKAVGYGQTRPVASNDTPEGRKKNRRTEVTILSH